MQCFIPIVVMLLLTAPVTIRLSRIVWINIFVKYNPPSKKIIENISDWLKNYCLKLFRKKQIKPVRVLKGLILQNLN